MSESRTTAAVELPPMPTLRPPILARRYAVSAGHYLASLAGIRVLDAGGNAVDAGVAAGLVLNVVQSDYTNVGGVAPIMVYLARTRQIVTLAGIGAWPKSASIPWFTSRGHTRIPGGIPATIVPSAVDAWLTALARFGTRSLAEVAAPAIELADSGFAVHQFLHDNLHGYRANMEQWPSTLAIYRVNGQIPEVGDLLVQKDLARTLRRLVEAEAASKSTNRAEAIMAARDRFYRGDIAREMVAYCQSEGGLLTEEDLADYHVEVGAPLSLNYHGYTVYSCGPWCQGPTVLQALGILRGFDLRALGHNSVDTLHLIAEALKLAFSDRNGFYGDPRFVDVPMSRLLSESYLDARRGMIDAARAWDRLPPAGEPTTRNSERSAVNAQEAAAKMSASGLSGPDTSYVCVVDGEGNAFSATPSDGAVLTPVVPGLGIVISDRGRQSSLDPNNPTSVAPGKRPRLTPNPGLVLKGDSLVMPYGTPGGDIQPQAMLQFLVNTINFGMEPQEAIESPRLATFTQTELPGRPALTPGQLKVEARLGDAFAGLEERGHRIAVWPAYAPAAGSVCAIAADGDRHLLTAAADVRWVSYAIGW
jgi:gamma-glutamyltranspeptidase / glutathione hydrolase